jgi:DNA-directed RNA polymerase subunit RPC12/RpoP
MTIIKIIKCFKCGRLTTTTANNFVKCSFCGNRIRIKIPFSERKKRITSYSDSVIFKTDNIEEMRNFLINFNKKDDKNGSDFFD